MKLESGTRRGFLVGALALMAAPAIVRADSLMKVVSIDLYDTRCLVDYEINSDQLVLRVDRRLETMLRPRGNIIVPLDIAKKLMPAHVFTMEPGPTCHFYAMRSITNQDLIQHGLVWV